jgi:hypothetical protein
MALAAAGIPPMEMGDVNAVRKPPEAPCRGDCGLLFFFVSLFSGRPSESTLPPPLAPCGDDAAGDFSRCFFF